MSIEGKISLQLSRAAFIEGIQKDCHGDAIKKLDLGSLTIKLELLEQYWRLFDDLHEKMVLKADDQFFTHTYMTEKVYDKALKNYAFAKLRLSQLIREEDDQAAILSESFRQRASSVQPAQSTRRALPEINLPKFSGVYSEWRLFRDLFSSMVGTNPDLSNVERMHYLQTSLDGEALRITANLKVSEESYENAWQLLTARYENGRLIVAAHLENLLNPAAMKNHSAKELNLLLETVTGSLNALKALGEPVESWGPIVVHTVVQKLSSKLREAWENKIGSSTKYPSLKEVQEFLAGRARALESIELNAPANYSSSSTQSLGQKARLSAQNRGSRGTAARVNVVQTPQPRAPMAPAQPNAQGQWARGSWADRSSRYACIYCQQDHYLTDCTRFLNLTPVARMTVVQQKGLCINCLGKHDISQCHCKKVCKLCGANHHSLIHDERSSAQTRSRVPARQPAPPRQSHGPVPERTYQYAGSQNSAQEAGVAQASAQEAQSTRPGVLLATCLAQLKLNHRPSPQVRLLIDPGSEVSLITERLVQQFNIELHHSSISISGIGNLPSGPTRGEVHIELQSVYSDSSIRVTAFLLKKLTSSLPSFVSKAQHWSHLGGLQLADPGYLNPAPVDILIGADVYGQLLEADVICGGSNSPSAQSTKFGWIIFGPTEAQNSAQLSSYHVSTNDEDVQLLLSKFWELEEVPTTQGSSLTEEEAQYEAHFLQTHCRDSSGRYIVRLPLKSSPAVLGSSYNSAHACLNQLLKRISKDENYFKLYSDFLQEYEEMDHMRRVTNSSSTRMVEADACSPLGMTLAYDTGDPSVSGGLRVPVRCQASQSIPLLSSYYFPHHGVLRESSTTTKLRVVFNGSSKTSSGISLNDIMHTGAKLQKDISDVLLWSRQHKLIFMTDITKMFRQIRVDEADWPLQQILWKDGNGDTITHQLTTVTYGTRSAPFLSIRVLNQLVEDEGSRFPLAISPLTYGRYVDDICGGAAEPAQLIETAQQTRDLCAAGCFPLAKWQSNCPELLQLFAPENISNHQRSYEESQTKILGLNWQPCSDNFVFTTNNPSSTTVTKRIILSEIAQLYDPLGFLAPVVIKAKMLLQSLWLEKLGWDDKVSLQTAQNWNHFREGLPALSTLKIPRWIGLKEGSRVEIHGFSDASQLAMSAVVYLKVYNDKEAPKITLVTSKTKVAPLKRLTIPRLELTAAVLLAKLVSYVQEMLKLKDVPVYLWTDSSVTLTWISSHPARWKEFVKNRVILIQELTQKAQWRFVPGKENPADCASRGLTAPQLATHQLWWTGPSWLKSSSTSWPVHKFKLDTDAQLEEKPGMVFTARVQSIEIWDLIDRYSSLNKLLRITAICQRFISRLKRIPNSSLNTPLNPGDIESARLFWIKAAQSTHFSSELKLLSMGQRFNKSHPMARLTAYIDHQGIMRVGGRLKYAQIHFESKHQSIIPKESQLAQLIIKNAHDRTLHGGTQLTLAQVRQNYWIIGGRAPIRSFILKCVSCTRHRQIRAQQLMGQLPAARLTQARAFLNTGVDYAGPVSLKSWKGRGHKSYKGWLVIFVCMSTSALHIEVVSDYSAEGFIAAYRRFTARRGICRNLYSDCGTNFLGADKELKRLFTSGSAQAQHLAHLLLNDGTQWSFNPPGAPHFGGKWEAAVKSVKFHLKRSIGESLLTYEELSTLLNQIESVLNSRPLEPLSNDPDDLSALTPAHFLIGEPLTSIPEPSLENLTESRLSRWQLIQQKLQAFWKPWSTSYLQQHQAISKWHHSSNDIRIGSLVMLSDERMPPSKWPLARIIALHPGSDGLTRVVTLKTSSSTFQRPISKLVVLPIAT